MCGQLYALLGIQPLSPLKDGSANTAIIHYRKRLLALVENNLPLQTALESEGKVVPEGPEDLYFDFFSKWQFPVRCGIACGAWDWHSKGEKPSRLPAP